VTHFQGSNSDHDPDRTWNPVAPEDTADTAVTERWAERGDPVSMPNPDPVGDASFVSQLRQFARINLGEMIGTKIVQVYHDDLGYEEISSDYLKVMRAVFAAPERFDSLYSRWRNPGSIVVLDRAPNTSRTTIAHALLATLCQEQPGIRTATLSFGGSTRFSHRRLPQQKNYAYLLDVPPDEDDFAVDPSFGASLGELGQALYERNCRAVILSNPGQWKRISRGAPAGITADLGDTKPIEIAEKWLLAENPAFDVGRWLSDHNIIELLTSCSPADVLDVVDLVTAISTAPERDLVDTDGGLPSRTGSSERAISGVDLFDRRVATVVAARSNWRQQLLAWHKQARRTSMERNFLVAAAVLKAVPVAHVYLKGAALGEALGEDKVPLKGQTVPGVIELVSAAHATLSHNDRVEFGQPEWDDAVLEYFWVDRPLVRKQFLRWLADAPFSKDTDALEVFPRDQARDLARRIAALCVRWAVRQRRSNPLAELAEGWHGTEHWPTLIDTLIGASLQPASARYIHEMLLDWSKIKSTPQRLAVVEACAGEFGRHNTGKALRRLRHVADSTDPRVAVALRQAVETLWEDDSVRAALFDTVVEWCTAHATMDAGKRTFSILATTTSSKSPTLPTLLLDDSGFNSDNQALANGWTALITTDADAELTRAVSLWLDAALLHPAVKDRVTEVLRTAIVRADSTNGEAPRDRVRAAIRRWSRQDDPGPEGRVELYNELSGLIDDDMISTFHGTLTVGDSGDPT
jgi:hypothetical protein